MTCSFKWLDFGSLCSNFVYFVVTCLALRFLVNYLFGKTHLAKCINQLPTATVPLRIILALCRGIKVAPPQAILMHVIKGACSLYGKSRIFCFWIGYRPAVVFFKPETVEVLLNNNKTIHKSIEYRLTELVLGKGLLTIPTDKWRNRRKLIDPAFHFSVLKNFMVTFNEQAMILVAKLLDNGEKGSVFDIVPLAKACTLDIICETAMGVSIKAQADGCTEFAHALGQLEENYIDLAIRPWYYLKFIRNVMPFGRKMLHYVNLIQETTENIIKEKKALLKNSLNNNVNKHSNCDDSPIRQKKAFLEWLLECQQKDNTFTNEHILDEVSTFLLAGHDTSGLALSYTLHNLGLHPKIQEKVIQEIDSIFGEDVDRPITTEDLSRMTYTGCVIKETLRLCPLAPILGRALTEDLKVLDYTIPPGSLCMIYLPMLHRDPESFPEPEKFDPDRFLPENSIGRHPYAFIPFSAGPRNCIGQRFATMVQKTILANIFRNMKVTTIDEHDKFHILIGATFKNADPLRMKITPRRTSHVH